jgi:diamine N-acetyltransferase
MTGKNILLRAVEPSDVDLLYKWENDTSIWCLSNTITPLSKFTLEKYIVNAHLDIYATKQLRLMIDLINHSENNKTIGCIDLFDFDPNNKRAGIGILINKKQRNKGYASEALELIIKYSFNTLKLHQLYCNISIDNDLSLKLFKKYDFQIIGVKKQWMQINNKWKDEYMLQLINT